jgi:hypothetical protein
VLFCFGVGFGIEGKNKNQISKGYMPSKDEKEKDS